MLETLQQLDQQILLSLNALHSPFWDSFMALFTAKLTWAPMYAAILFVICKNFSPWVVLLSVIAIVLTIVYSDQLCSSVIRPAIERMRPSNPNNPVSEYIHLLNGRRGGKYGFPSCHASNSFGLAFFLLFLFRQKVISIFILLWAVVNSYSRIYAGVHYPGDLIAGMLVGLSGAILLYGLWRYLIRIPHLAAFLKVRTIDMARITHRQPFVHTPLIVYTGLITMTVFIVYSAVVL